MQIRPIYVAPKPRYIQVNRQYLRDSDFSQNHTLRVSIAETLSTVHQSQRACPTLWGRVEKLSAFAFALLLIIIIYKKLLFKGISKVVGKDFACVINLCATQRINL